MRTRIFVTSAAGVAVVLLLAAAGLLATRRAPTKASAPIPLAARYQDGVPQAKIRLSELETRENYRLARDASRALTEDYGWFFESAPLGRPFENPVVHVQGMPSGGVRPKVSGYILSKADSPVRLVAIGELSAGAARLQFTGTALAEDILFVVFTDERPFDADLKMELSAAIE